ncbi:unnamed protein product [Rotaria socialis]|uniref:Uncharacterized protein n=1 Tax=Rotaria socialis TaxID=392032 RepID=A0A821ST81_9BILA|nr:unnamed protein product [Rotaria socialis]
MDKTGTSLTWHISVGKLSGAHQAAVMCLAVDSSVSGTDVVVTGSKDHYIKLSVNETHLLYTKGIYLIGLYTIINDIVFDVGSNYNGLISPRRSLEPPHYDGIQSLALYGDILFSGSRDTCIKKWDLHRGEHIQSLNNAHKDWVCALCFLPGGQIVLSGE